LRDVIQERIPLRFSRRELISAEQAERIHALARRTLQHIGLEIRHPAALDALGSHGFRVAGQRVFFDAAIVDAQVEEMRQWIAASASEPPPDDGRLSLGISTYSLYIHDVDTGQVVSATTDRLIQMTKLVDTLAEERVHGAPPGIPTEVHPDLQPLAQYRIAANTARQGAQPVDPTSARTAPHLLDMAEVMGRPITSLPVYLVSPLRLGGESLDVVLACQERLSHISVSSMPAASATAPVHPFGALALAAAETIGGTIAVHALTGKPVTFGVGVFPFDLRAGAMVFGSP